MLGNYSKRQMSRSTHLGQRYHVVQVTKYHQHRKVLEIGAELTILETEDVATVTADKLAAPELVFSATALNFKCFKKRKEIPRKIDVLPIQ